MQFKNRNFRIVCESFVRFFLFNGRYDCATGLSLGMGLFVWISYRIAFCTFHVRCDFDVVLKRLKHFDFFKWLHVPRLVAFRTPSNYPTKSNRSRTYFISVQPEKPQLHAPDKSADGNFSKQITFESRSLGHVEGQSECRGAQIMKLDPKSARRLHTDMTKGF